MRRLVFPGGLVLLLVAAVVAAGCQHPLARGRSDGNSQWDPGGGAIIDLIWHGLEGVESAHYRLTLTTRDIPADPDGVADDPAPYHGSDTTEGYVDFAQDSYHVTSIFEWPEEPTLVDDLDDTCLLAFPEAPRWETIRVDGEIYDQVTAIPPDEGEIWVDGEYDWMPVEHGPEAVFAIDLYSSGATGLFPRGKETIHGVETTHYRVTYNVSESYSNDGEVEDWEREIVEGYAAFTFEVDVWLDTQDRVRRLTYTEMLKPGAWYVEDEWGEEVPGDYPELSATAHTYTLDVFAYDEDFPIAAPEGEVMDGETYWEAYDAWWEECYAELEDAGEPVVQVGR